MSIPTESEARNFISNLRGRSAVFLFRDKKTKVNASNYILKSASILNMRTKILDADAFYCNNLISVTRRLDENFMRKTELLIPDRYFTVRSLAKILPLRSELLILDGLNSIYSLTSNGRQARQLLALAMILSYFARTNDRCVIFTIYRTGWTYARAKKKEEGGRQSLASVGDILVNSNLNDRTLEFEEIELDSKGDLKKGFRVAADYFAL